MATKKAEEVKADEAAKADAEDEGMVDSVEDVLQPTGGAEGGLEESKAKEAEAKGEDPKKAKKEEEAKKDVPEGNPVDRDLNAEAAPFAGTAVAGSQEKTFQQQGQLYTDGLSGEADHNLDRAYGSGA